MIMLSSTNSELSCKNLELGLKLIPETQSVLFLVSEANSLIEVSLMTDK
jgi:hypothetical protein